VIVAELSAFPAAALASAWLVGDVSYTGEIDGGLDYAVHPLAIPQLVVTLVGVAGLVVLLAAVVLVRPVRRARLALALLIVAGIGAGAGYRIVTAGVIGANIGAGLVFVLLGPIVLALLVAAGIVTVRSRRPDRRNEPRRAPSG
jgi:hypothetical protein